MADATGVNSYGIDGTKDDSWLKVKSERMDIIISTYIS